MHRITICTQKFKDELYRFANERKEIFTVGNDPKGVYYAVAAYDDIDLGELVDLVYTLIILKNPAAGYSLKLSGMIKSRLLKHKQSVADGLEDYFVKNRTINLEGYIHFRLWEYTLAIDNVLYAIIKNELKGLPGSLI